MRAAARGGLLPVVGARLRGRHRRGGELPAQQRGKETLPEGGEGRPLSPAASSAPNYGGGDEGRSGNSTPSGEETAPTNTGANAGAENSPRNSAAKNLSLRGGRPPAEPGGLISAKLWRRPWGPLGVLHAQRQGDGAHEYGRQGRGRDLPAQQRRKNLSLMGGGPPAEPRNTGC